MTIAPATVVAQAVVTLPAKTVAPAVVGSSDPAIMKIIVRKYGTGTDVRMATSSLLWRNELCGPELLYVVLPKDASRRSIGQIGVV